MTSFGGDSFLQVTGEADPKQGGSFVRCQFWQRLPAGQWARRGPIVGVESASGSMYLNRIGSGKLVAPADILSTTGVKIGDMATVWLESELSTLPHRVCEFIVQSRVSREGRIELSGGDLFEELNGFTTFEKIGKTDETETTLSTAVWGPRRYNTQDATTAGKHRVLFTTPTKVQIGDVMVCQLQDEDDSSKEGNVFTSVITFVSDGTTAVEFEDDLTATLAANAPVVFYSNRITVADATDFTPGEVIKVGDLGGEISFPVFTSIIDSVQDNDAGGDWVYLTNYIFQNVAAGEPVRTITKTSATTNDIAQLFQQATYGTWAVIRHPEALVGTSYDPNGDTAFQALLAIADMTGYAFRLSHSTPGTEPVRKVYYFPLNRQNEDNSGRNPRGVHTLGTELKLEHGFAYIYHIEAEDANERYTHVTPFGAGSGWNRFDFRDADIAGVLEDYPDFLTGVTGPYYYVFDKTKPTEVARMSVQQWSHIKPVNEQNPGDRREAGNQLLRTACEWLKDNSTPDVTWSVECHTISDPWPGDAILTIDPPYDEPSGAIRDFFTAGESSAGPVMQDLVVTEVHHEVAENGLRLTKLICNKGGLQRYTGEALTARLLLDMQRARRHTNTGTTGGARVTGRSATWRGNTTIKTTTGALTVGTDTASMVIDADDDMTVSVGLAHFEGEMLVSNVVTAAAGIKLPVDGSTGGDYRARYVEIDGMRVLASGELSDSEWLREANG